jgi:4-amino-4-deoxy-L-arabinose transferase-like glycosyltransferase
MFPPAAWNFTTHVKGLAASGLFILLSVMLIPYAGIQDDEALFAQPLFEPVARDSRIGIFHHAVPLMIMSYLGALKTWIYAPLLAWFGSGVWAVRLPMVIVGAITVFLFFQLLLMVRTRTAIVAATLGAFLLATDPAFLLTNTFDWGPVALEHLLLMTGCVLLARFALGPQRARYLFWGFFVFGLALWDKAIFFWALGGLAAGAVAVFWREVRGSLSPRNLAVALSAFILGASPLIIFNVRRPNATLGENTHLEVHFPSSKWVQVKIAANGNSLFGILANEEWVPQPKPVASHKGRAALWIRNHFGEHRQSGFYYVFGLLVAAVPLWWRSRAARFSLVFLCVAWLLMAYTKDAGGATHHVILLWPFPLLFASVAIANLPWRPVAILAGTALVIMNLLVVNQYLLQLERDGAAGDFTDALFPLSTALSRSPGDIYVMDWGIFYTMDLAHRGRLHMYSATDALGSDSPDATQQAQIVHMLSDPGAVFVGHVAGRQHYPEIPPRLDRFAAAQGYLRQTAELIRDSNGRPVFQIYRYVKAHGGLLKAAQ